MTKRMIVGAAIAVMAGVAGADYLFPSYQPPANLSPEDPKVKQFVTFIWDDNAYTGLDGTVYETKPKNKWDEMGRVGNKPPVPNDTWTKVQDPLKISEGKIGVSWAVRTLAGSKKNPDGSAVTMSFNVITGQLVPVKGGWSATPTETSQTGFKGKAFKTVDWDALPEEKVRWAPVCWGREYPQVGDKGDSAQPNWTGKMYKEIMDKGHELGNHTIDHMETNSGLPPDLWPAPNKEGYDTDPNENEDYKAWETIGWIKDAGRKLSLAGWKGAIKLGEDQLNEYLKATVANGKIFAFRAPRLEVNSNMFFALKELNYLYDCGLEEGFEAFVNDKDQAAGTNFCWPYTTDNGTPNSTYQRSIGEKVYIDSMPAGLWQIPVNVMIVPEAIRDAAFKNYEIIQDAEIKKGWRKDKELLDDWKSGGAKVTGFDFNLFILWGFSNDQVKQTLEYNLDMRMKGSKAPMQIGCHTDYFTPNYDFATCLNDINKDVYGLVITNKWNTWDTRIKVWEDFVTYTLGKKAYVVSGKRLIDEIKKMQVGETPAKKETDFFKEAEWNSFTDGSLTTINSEKVINGALDAKITFKKAGTGDAAYAGYVATVGAGYFKGMSHIEVDYKTTQSIRLAFNVEGDKDWEVILGNLNRDVKSGTIPLNAFHYSDHNMGTNKSLDVSKISGIIITPVVSSKDGDVEANFKLNKLTLWGAEAVTAISSNVTVSSALAVKNVMNNQINLSVPVTGNYSIAIYGMNGRVVRSINASNLSAGLNSVRFDALTKGLYVVKVTGLKTSLTHKAMIL